jgi:NADPH-dependent 2,4-dienoyl-CoA reductase/sulfur reductase-like enzyme
MLATAGALAGLGPAARARASARVLVVGGGFAGSACALSLKQLNPALDLALIDPVTRYSTCPMSNEVIVGLRDLRSITVTRDGLRGRGITVIGERVSGIDATQRRVRLTGGASLSYDRLVVAPGIRLLWERIEGLNAQASMRMPHAWIAGDQTTRLATQLSRMPDGGVVAISVPAGPMRCPPGPYERASLIAHYLARHKPRSKLLILDANNSFPRQPQFADAWRQLYPGRIEWIPMTQDGAVIRVDASNLTLFTASAAHRVAVANVIPPQAPGELAPASGLAADHGWCPIDPNTFESLNVPAVHVIGDACIADAMPKSGSAAFSQAQHCAAAIDAMLSGRSPPAAPFDSVCYGRLSPVLALAFPGHFTVEDGKILAPEPAVPPSTSLDRDLARRESRAAEQWYTDIRARAFAA